MFSLFVGKDKKYPMQLLNMHQNFKIVLYMAGLVRQRISTAIFYNHNFGKSITF